MKLREAKAGVVSTEILYVPGYKTFLPCASKRARLPSVNIICAVAWLLMPMEEMRV